MIHFCTLSDSNYFLQAMTLYYSLAKNSKDFIFHFLCLDQDCFEKVSNISFKLFNNIIAYNVENIKKEDNVLIEIEKGKFKTEYTSHQEFCWTLSPYFTRYILNKIKPSSLFYVDADIYFHQSFLEFYQHFDGKDVGIFRHRQNSLEVESSVGWFNVGVLFFRNTTFGSNLLNWWTEQTLTRENKKLATCGDQRFLDGFLDFNQSLLLIDGNIGHGAPWHWKLYKFDDINFFNWENKRQKLFFTHFSNFKYNLKSDTYQYGHDAWTDNGKIIKDCRYLTKIYNNYFNEIKIVNDLIKGI